MQSIHIFPCTIDVDVSFYQCIGMLWHLPDDLFVDQFWGIKQWSLFVSGLYILDHTTMPCLLQVAETSLFITNSKQGTVV